jgi:hypothetical protein
VAQSLTLLVWPRATVSLAVPGPGVRWHGHRAPGTHGGVADGNDLSEAVENSHRLEQEHLEGETRG